jgi:PAS domain S-box-containing protein
MITTACIVVEDMEKQVAVSIQKSELKSLKSTHTATLDELERYKLLVDNVEDYAIFLLDRDGYIQTWNKGAKKNKGWNAEEIIGKHFSTFYLQSDIDAHKPERELKLARQLGRVEDEDWRVRKDGSQFWANVVITTLKNDDGEIVGFAKVTRDLTERKQNEDMLRSSNALLKKQQRELEALNVSKDEFISLASHQLRTPATAVKQLLGMLTQGFVGDVAQAHLELISRAYDANERQIRIVENLLKVAQLDAGKVVLRHKAVNVHDLLTDIAEEHMDRLAKKSQKISLELTPSMPATILADPDHLRMAVENLIDNASKYTAEGGSITVSVDHNDESMFISVQDNGIGINPHDRKLLFKKFSRINNELSEHVGGSGLGLYWVKRVIEMHHGDVTVESTINKGSTFTISLPLEQPDA